MNHVTISSQALKSALANAAMVIERRVSIPVLNHVLIDNETTSPRVNIVGTDLDMEITTPVDAIAGTGVFKLCLPLAQLKAIADASRGQNITIYEPEEGPAENKRRMFDVNADTRITVGERWEYKLQSLPASDYPEMKQALPLMPLDNFTNGMLSFIIKKLSTSISTEETRYYLNGICWDQSGFTSTDGHRLGHIKHGLEGKFSYIIPRKACSIIQKLSARDDAKVTASAHNMNFSLKSGTQVLTKLIDGTYPDYGRVMPKYENGWVVLEFIASDLIDAVEAAAAIATNRWRSIKFEKGEDDKVALSSSNPDFGLSKISTETAWPKELVGYIAYNNSYLLQFLKAMDKSRRIQLVLDAKQPSFTPVMIKHDDEEMLRILMPMRV